MKYLVYLVGTLPASKSELLRSEDKQFQICERFSDPHVCAAKGQMLRIEFESSISAPVLVEAAGTFAPLARIVLGDAQGLVAAGVVRELRQHHHPLTNVHEVGGHPPCIVDFIFGVT